MLCLRDPADETNDLGRKGIAIKHVQATFAHLHRTLAQDVKANTRVSLLTPLVGTSYMLNLGRRKKLEDYGVRVAGKMRMSLAQTAKAIREADQVGEKKQEVAVNAKDKGPQEPANDMTKILPTEAQKTTVSEHSNTVLPSLGTSAVETGTDGSQPQRL